MNESIVIPATYDYGLVALSVIIAVCAAYAALDLTGRVVAARNNFRVAWLCGGAIAMGTGIWSMHFTGMLAYRLPVPVYYHIPTVTLSLVAAIVASFIALFVVSRERMTPIRVIVGGLLMAGGICTMHYTGMAAMRLPAMHHYDTGWVLLSVAIALFVSWAALGLTSQFREDAPGLFFKVGCAVIMGFAIPAMHYTAMMAVSYTPVKGAPDLTFSAEISALGNSAIIIITFVILGAVFLLRQRSVASSRNTSVAQTQGRQPA